METESSQVREFIEKLVEKLVSGGLDDVSVDKLHSHPAYDRMFACHHTNLCEALARLSFALQMAIANKPLPEEDSPTAAHTALKKLIHDIIQEAMTLPAMQVDTRKAPMQGSYATEDEIALKTYEDILATAILNKVIERYQSHRFHNGSALDGNSNLVSASYSTVSMEQQTKYISSLEIGVKKVDDESLSSKEISESDSDEIHWKKSDVADPSLSLTIEERIEEVTTYSNSDCEEDNDDPEEKLFVPDLKLLQRRVPFPEFGMDIVEGEATGGNANGNDSLSDSSTEHKPTDIVSPVESWEENWLFQRRRLKTGAGSTQMPVPMLVPNPSEDIRALIGDRDAEDISDLSECSDSVLEEMVLAEVEENKSQNTDDSYMLKNDVLVPSLLDIGETSDFDVTTVIGNEIKANNNQNEELLIRITAPDEDESGIRNTDLDVREATNFELMKTSLDCSSEFGQKDSEYTEDFDAVTQRQMESLTNLSETETSAPPVPKPRSAVLNGETSVTVAEASSAEPDEISTVSVLDGETLPYAAPPRPGTIAEREHKKWETAPPLPNNPYSPENISKRLKNRMQLSSSQSSSSEASVEFPELKEETILPGPITEPLHIICAPQDLDYKRYGRDYYVNAKKQDCEKKSQLSNQTLLKDTRPRNNTPKVENTGASHICVTGSDKQSEQKITNENEINVPPMKELILSTERKSVPEGKTSIDQEPDPEIPAPGTVIHEIARWQGVINETEQLWMKSAEAAISDNHNITVEEEPVKIDTKTAKIQKIEMKPKISDIYLKEISNTKKEENMKEKPMDSAEIDELLAVTQNGYVKNKISHMKIQGSNNSNNINKNKVFQSPFTEEINSLKHNGNITNAFSNINIYENNDRKILKENAFNMNSNNKFHNFSATSVEETENIKQNGDVKSRISIFNHQATDSNKSREDRVASDPLNSDELSNKNARNNKPTPKPRTEGKIEIIHTKTNVTESISHIEVANKRPEITVSSPADLKEQDMTFKDIIRTKNLNASFKHDTMSVTSEGSINSSDSEVYNFLPSVRQLAKQFSGTQESDSSVSSIKGSSPVPIWNRMNGKMKRTPTPETQNLEEHRLAESPLPPRNTLSPSPSHPVREIHSLTARSISREFREGLKRNFPAQMDKNLYTIGSDSSQSPPRSYQRNGLTTQENDSTPGYTSDDSSFVSSSPPNEVQSESRQISGSMSSLTEKPKGKTLQSSIEFWEQLKHK